NDPVNDGLSDSESVAENLSKAASRLVISDGDLAVVGPSSLQFHRPSPITRNIPLEDVQDDAPKHALHISGEDAPPSRGHSRNPSYHHDRSRSHSQSRSIANSRASSGSPSPAFAGNVSPPSQGAYANISPPATSAIPFYDAPSPGSDHTSYEPAKIEQMLGFQRGPTSPNTHVEEDGEDGYDWRQMLPQDVEISRVEHDTVLDIFFKVFSSWCYRTIPDLFLRDMRRYLEIMHSASHEHSETVDGTPIGPRPKTVHYTPMLHNAILSIALAYSDDPILSRRSTRAKFVEQAKSTLEVECSRPSLSCVQALAYIASFYSGEGEQTLGFLFFGMSIRMSQALGLSLDCSSWVRSGHISALDEIDRVWTYWVTYSLDKCWAFYVGRDHGLPNPLLRLYQSHSATSPDPHSNAQFQELLVPPAGVPSPTPAPTIEIHYPSIDEKADNSPWEWRTPGNWNLGNAASRKTMPTTPSGISSAFYQTTKLMVLATKVMNSIWKLPRNAGSESIASLALDVDSWLEELPDSMRITRPKTSQALPHVLMVNMAHQWIQIILHRPFYRLTRNKGDRSIKRCDSGCEKILQYLAAWRRLYGLRYVPITVVQIAFVAGTTCLLKAIQSVNMPEKRRGALDDVREIVRTLNEMARTWKAARQSAEALKALLHEQVSASERSPGPSRHPTVELHPPSVANSRAQTMDMMAFELHSSTGMPLSGQILEEGSVFAEPPSDLMSGPFLQGGAYTSDSPGSHHSGHYFEGMGGFDPGLQGYAGGTGANMDLPTMVAQGNMQQGGMDMGLGGHGAGTVNVYGFPQFGQFVGANDARLRAGESFPTHPIGHFHGGHNPAGSVGNAAEAWLGPEFTFGGPVQRPQQQQQQPQQPHQAFWGQ
ncbi:hypothetical protein FRC20_004583, partial [Serendipita sp. 405]